MIVIAILFLLAIAMAVTVVIEKSRRDFHYTRIASLSTASESDTIGGVGVSILCASPKHCAIITSLLDSTYPTCEVIVAISSKKQHNLVAQIELRYSLVSHNKGDIEIYKSENSSLSRLTVIVFHMLASRDKMLNMAAKYATFDYLLCVPSESYLLPFAVGRVAVAIAATNVGCVDRITTSERGVFAVSKKEWIKNGGATVTRHPKSRKTVHIAEYLTIDDTIQNAHYVLIERSRYNFLDFLALKIMKYRNKVLSLIKP